jgi:hypothetical protein
MPARLDIYLQRNEDWSRSLYVSAAGQPIDLTGMTVAMQVRDKLAQTLVASATCELSDPTNGEITVTLKASEGSALASYGNPIQTANLPYDIRITENDGFQTILFAGLVILARGETMQ